MNISQEEFNRFRKEWERYENLEKMKFGHIMSPCDPRKQLYKKTLRSVNVMLAENPRLAQMICEVREFEALFERELVSP